MNTRLHCRTSTGLELIRCKFDSLAVLDNVVDSFPLLRHIAISSGSGDTAYLDTIIKKNGFPRTLKRCIYVDFYGNFGAMGVEKRIMIKSAVSACKGTCIRVSFLDMFGISISL